MESDVIQISSVETRSATYYPFDSRPLRRRLFRLDSYDESDAKREFEGAHLEIHYMFLHHAESVPLWLSLVTY